MDRASCRQEIERLERAFWQSMVDGNVDVATAMLADNAVMVTGHGAVRFDHAGYEKMARDDRYRLVDYRLSKFDVDFPVEDVAVATYAVDQAMEAEGRRTRSQAFDSSTWVRRGGEWKCVAHTESAPAPGA